jgi:hypothetical protein
MGANERPERGLSAPRWRVALRLGLPLNTVFICAPSDLVGIELASGFELSLLPL